MDLNATNALNENARQASTSVNIGMAAGTQSLQRITHSFIAYLTHFLLLHTRAIT
jgi:hypothetical protein